MSLVRIHSPETESELAVVVAMLEAHDIPCFIHNRNFGSLYPGLQINAYNTQSIMIEEERVKDALQLLREFREASPTPQALQAMSWSDKLRIIIEGLLLGWFVPGTKPRKDDTK